MAEVSQTKAGIAAEPKNQCPITEMSTDHSDAPTAASSSDRPVAKFTGMKKKDPEEQRSIWDLFSPENLKATAEHCMQRDWSNTKWDRIAYVALYHALAVPGLYNFLFECQWKTVALWVGFVYWAGISFCGGIHRLWSHKSYKAHPVVEVIYAMGCTIAAPNAFTNSIFEWVREHRVHHKYSETDADHINSTRGFFFAHIGWMFMPPHPDVEKYAAENNLDDLTNNKIIMFQHNFYYSLTALFTFILPTMIPVYFWDEGLWTAFTVCCWRITIFHHFTWLVNSLAHWQGDHPYDNSIYPAENMFTSIVAFGEGWHNFHHRFPTDWRCSDKEFGLTEPIFNVTSTFIKACEKIGLTWGFVQVNQKMIDASIEKFGE